MALFSRLASVWHRKDTKVGDPTFSPSLFPASSSLIQSGHTPASSPSHGPHEATQQHPVSARRSRNGLRSRRGARPEPEGDYGLSGGVARHPRRSQHVSTHSPPYVGEGGSPQAPHYPAGVPLPPSSCPAFVSEGRSPTSPQQHLAAVGPGIPGALSPRTGTAPHATAGGRGEEADGPDDVFGEDDVPLLSSMDPTGIRRGDAGTISSSQQHKARSLPYRGADDVSPEEREPALVSRDGAHNVSGGGGKLGDVGLRMGSQQEASATRGVHSPMQHHVPRGGGDAASTRRRAYSVCVPFLAAPASARGGGPPTSSGSTAKKKGGGRRKSTAEEEEMQLDQDSEGDEEESGRFARLSQYRYLLYLQMEFCPETLESKLRAPTPDPPHPVGSPAAPGAASTSGAILPRAVSASALAGGVPAAQSPSKGSVKGAAASCGGTCGSGRLNVMSVLAEVREKGLGEKGGSERVRQYLSSVSLELSLLAFESRK